jgi:hypothetical protein
VTDALRFRLVKSGYQILHSRSAIHERISKESDVISSESRPICGTTSH